MEKKNINIGVVRTCTILLLTVFTIGRKYGQEQKATDLINKMKQQPCACCLNFDNVNALAEEIDEAKNQLQNEKKGLEATKIELEVLKNQLEVQNGNLANEKEELKNDKRLLQNDNIQLQNQKVRLEEKKIQLEKEIQKKDDEKNELQNQNKELQSQINNLRDGNKENAGAVQVAEVVNGKLSQYIEDLAKTNKLNIVLQNEKQKISEENAKLEKTLNESKEKLKEKDKEIEDTKKQIEELKNIKEKIENDLKIKNEGIETCKKEKDEFSTKKTQLENDLKKLEADYKEKYEKIVSKNGELLKNNTGAVEKNTEEIRNINASLTRWKDENNKITKEIKDKTQEIKELNNKIKENNSRIDELNEEKEKLNSKYNDLDIAHEDLKQNYKKIEQEKTALEDSFNVCKQQIKYLTTQTNTLNDILKNTKTNVNMEEYANLYNSINAQKRTNINTLLSRNVKTFPEKQYTFYIPFKFKDYGQCAIKKTISEVFTKNPGIYATNLSLYDILRSFFEIKAFEKFKELKIIKVTNLKEIYFDVSFLYEGDKIKIEGKEKDVEKNREKNIELPEIVTSPKTQGNATFNRRNEKKEFTNYDKVADGTAYEKCMNRFFLDYSNLIELVGIDEYLNKRGEGKIEDKKDKVEDKEDLFLLELDFKDPECIALLESVGKGNYGVVKKGLTFENGELVTKAIKFTCSNSDFENSKEENILKEIRAGKIVNEIGVGNKIAFVQDYMKIKEFKKRYDYKKEEEKKIEIVPLKEETEDGDLTNAVYTTFLNEKLETLPGGKENVSKDFQNNVFSKKGKIDEYLYIMFMDIVNGKDLFLSEKKEELDINSLGDMLFDVLKNLYISGVALKDIKPKNIMWDKQNKEFSIIDVQTLGMNGSDLADCCGTPELWPFFKTLNLNLERNNEIENTDKKNKLYDIFCNSIDDNFVDIYAACMTMYFAKFSTYTAAGLLTLLLKWIVLDEENVNNKKWKEVSLDKKIEFLKDYKTNYIKYISCKKNNTKPNDENTIFFFENIDDKNLNNVQKLKLNKLLVEIINREGGNNFYLLKDINDKIKGIEVNDFLEKEEEKKEKTSTIDDKDKETKKKKKKVKKNNKKIEEKNNIEKPKKESKEELNEEGINNIINFYKLCIENDFENFKSLSDKNCKYADVIKYVLCYGSCLNYNGGKEEMKVDGILGQLKLKENIKIEDKEFFNDSNNAIKNVIDNLRSGFNQTFIIDLLTILPLEKYNEILEHDVNKDSVNYYFKSKIDSLKEKDKKNGIEEMEKQKKVFYLLRYLEINKLFHIPKNILKINSLIDKNTNNKLVGKKNIDKK